MAKFLKIVNGVPRMVDVTAASVYEAAYDVSSNISAGTAITLPGGHTYDGAELTVFLNGQKLLLTEDYAYVGTPPRTQVSFTFDLIPGDRIVFRTE